MAFRELLVHERTLLGALDSYFKQLVQTKPFLLSRYEDKLDALAEHWLLTGGENRIDAVNPDWLRQYIAQTDDPASMQTVVADFQSWLVRQSLIDMKWLEV